MRIPNEILSASLQQKIWKRYIDQKNKSNWMKLGKPYNNTMNNYRYYYEIVGLHIN